MTEVSDQHDLQDHEQVSPPAAAANKWWDVYDRFAFMVSLLIRKLPLLNRFLRRLSCATNISRMYFVHFFIITSLIIFLGTKGWNLMENIVAYAYPIHRTLKALEGGDAAASEWCLKHWTVFGFFKFFEPIVEFALGWLPFYHSLKLIFFLWLYFPMFEGSLLLCDQILLRIDQVNSASVDELTEKVVKELQRISEQFNLDEVASSSSSPLSVAAAAAAAEETPVEMMKTMMEPNLRRRTLYIEPEASPVESMAS